MKGKSAKKPPKTHVCDHCNKIILGSSYKFKSHLYQHNAVNSRHNCKYCSKQFYRKDAFLRHVLSHTGDAKQFVCDYCDRGYVDKRNLITHLKLHDDTHHSPKYKCPACGVTYCEQRLLKYHIRKEHFNLESKSTNSHEKKNLNERWVERVSETEVYVEMTKVNNNIIRIKKVDSIKKEESEENVEGKKIKEEFDWYAQYILTSKDTSQYSKAVCDYCKKEMLKKSLRLHMREKHLNVRKFVCESCKRSFKRHYQLVDHVCGKVRQRKRKVNVL
ncbi:uncharacterized protein ACR2FA_011005 [Aphomia sociella]